MGRIILYSHGGSGNHGCEAIVRSTLALLPQKETVLYSLRIDEDYRYHLNDLVLIYKDQKEPNSKIEKIKYLIKYKLFKDDRIYYSYLHQSMYANTQDGDLAISIGGDNYCYQGLPEKLSEYNEGFKKKHVPTVLWGCSIEPELIQRNDILSDLKKYRLIIARESITFESLKKNGVQNVLLYPDPAFFLEKTDIVLPNEFGNHGIVGINLSPLVEQYSKDQVLENYYQLVNYILKNTSYDILLIPHVVWKDLDDRESLEKIAKHFPNEQRINIATDCDCCTLKGYISKCDYFIGARTHSTIAAYSLNIPTLVLGYSVKSKGIALDLFGTYENYVIPVQELENKYELLNSFIWLLKNKQNIITALKNKNKIYKEKLKELTIVIEGMDYNAKTI